MKNICNKKKFDSIGAKLALAKARLRLNHNRNEKRIYKCTICNMYHLTSK